MKIYAIYKMCNKIPELLSYYLKFHPSEEIDISGMYFKEFGGVAHQLYGFIYKKELYEEFFKQRKKKYYHVRVLVVEEELIKKYKEFFRAFKISWVKYKSSFDNEEHKIRTMDILSSNAEHDYISSCWTELVFNPSDYPYLCPELFDDVMQEKWMKPLSMLTVNVGIDIFTEGNGVPLDMLYDEFEYQNDDSIRVSKEFETNSGTWYIDMCLHANEAALFVKVFQEELRR